MADNTTSVQRGIEKPGWFAALIKASLIRGPDRCPVRW
jgi:hypothetical protein